MYKELKEIDIKKVRLDCTACPTIYSFVDKEDDEYYFRLRHGYARLVMTEHGTGRDETLLSDSFIIQDDDSFDGFCSWRDVQLWAIERGVFLNKEIDEDEIATYLTDYEDKGQGDGKW